MRWVVLLAVAGCYGPALPTGAPCDTTSECPPPLVCDRGHCEREYAPDIDADVDAIIEIDGNPGCVCVDATKIQCNADPEMTCALGCVAEDEGARCGILTPSNGVAIALTGVSGAVSVSVDATFDTTTGAITGSVTRPAGTGVIQGIGYTQQVASGVQLGVFTFESLSIAAPAKAVLVGTRAAVFVVATTATIDGSIDLSAGCGNDRSCAGPGGGAGSTVVAAAGCGPGGTGQSDPSANSGGDGGGGGGGGGAIAGAGGRAGTLLGGAAGMLCLGASNEPLVGGSGGGAGGVGTATGPASGGGGGGAFQLTALEKVVVTGQITASGAGGGGGPGSGTDAAAGAGGGAGGAILIEAPIVTIGMGASLSANGGGGGGGGLLANTGTPGQSGQIGSTPANGGAGAGGIAAARGGNGGAGTIAAATPSDVPMDRNGGGGGGAVGRIYLRAVQLMNGGASSPVAGSGPLRSH